MWQVKGHSKAVESLERSIRAGRLAHAYLITGPPQVGKMTLALNLAQILNCQGNCLPSERCRSCHRIANGTHSDVQIINRSGDNGSGTKKEISIGQIRDMQKTASLQPYEGKYRVFIIDGAEYLNEESSNCLLKTLEEPPDNVIIILLTITSSVLLPTILSRCQAIDLLPVQPQFIEKILIDHWNADQDKAKCISRLSGGAIGWAINALTDDSILRERSKNISESVDIMSASISERFDLANRLSNQYSKDRIAVEKLLYLWLEWWRDLLYFKADCSQLVINREHLHVLEHQCGTLTINDVKLFIKSILQAIDQLHYNANPRLVFEVLLLNLPYLGRSPACSRII